MKNTLALSIATLSVLTTAVASAQITNSVYETRHQNALQIAIENSCGLKGQLTQVQATETVIHVDQGIQDKEFVTELNLTVRIDQGQYDNYKVITSSTYADLYDHQAKVWGHYSVNQAVCMLK